MSVHSLTELLVIKPSLLEGKEGVAVVPDLIFQADFPSGAGYLLAEDALVFGNNLIERWRAGGGLLTWVRGAVRHEGLHYFMAHLSAEKQDEVVEMMSAPRNLSLLRQFYAVMRSVASEYIAPSKQNDGFDIVVSSALNFSHPARERDADKAHQDISFKVS